MSLDHEYKPHKCGHGHQPVYRSPSPLIYNHTHGTHNNYSPNACVVGPEAPHNLGHSETALSHSTIVCKCVENQCTHCGLFRHVSMPHHVPAMVYVPIQVCTTLQGQMLTVNSSPGIQRTQRRPRACREHGAKSKADHLSSAAALQRKQLQAIVNQKPAESDSEMELEWSSTSDDPKPNQTTLCATET